MSLMGISALNSGSSLALGMANPEQAAKVMHVSNLYRVPGAERLAARLVEATFADSVFFCNSGAEANEGMDYAAIPPYDGVADARRLRGLGPCVVLDEKHALSPLSRWTGTGAQVAGLIAGLPVPFRPR